jgi:hypothetical protein
MKKLRVGDLHGKRTLILGEAGIGKTRFTTRLFRAFAKKYRRESAVLIDMAPPVMQTKGRKIGGHLDFRQLPANVYLLRPPAIAAPRIQGKTPTEVRAMAEANRAAIEPLIDRWLEHSVHVLMINDLTLYLHAGSVERIVEAIRRAKTFIGNAYYGELLRDDHGSALSVREREAVELLQRSMDYVIRLPLDEDRVDLGGA